MIKFADLERFFKQIHNKELDRSRVQIALNKFVLDKTLKYEMMALDRFLSSQVHTVDVALNILSELEQEYNDEQRITDQIVDDSSGNEAGLTKGKKPRKRTVSE